MHSESDGLALMPSVAQSNLALYKQLHAAGWDIAQLVTLRDCYEFATTLFAGHCRASGKPFLVHLVGTASILAAVGADCATVMAGLLHAAYEQGDFGFTRLREKRTRVRRVIGDAAESLVWRYQALGWQNSTVARLRDDLAELTTTDRAIVLIRLANELDDNLDLEMRYCHPARDEHRQNRETFVALAQALRRPALANALTAAYREADDGAWAASLSLNRKYSYQLASPFGLRLLQLTHAVVRAGRRKTGRHGSSASRRVPEKPQQW
jgi:(p)ppGpp synthase/HD superfamily hydrolase